MRLPSTCRSLGLAWIAFATLIAGPVSATSFTLTINGSTPPGGDVDLPVGTTIEVLVGLDDVIDVQAYTLGIEYDDTELSFLQATQLASEKVGTEFAVKKFTLDPSAMLTIGTTGRASVLQIPTDGPLFIDGRTTLPTPDPRAGFFALSFEIIRIDADGLADLTVGLLDSTKDEISAVGGGVVTPVPDSISISVVPEPTTDALVLAGLALLGCCRRIPLR